MTIQDRLRGKYAIGPVMENGEPEFGYREFRLPNCDKCGRAGMPPIQLEAADYIDELEAKIESLENKIDDMELAAFYEETLRD